MKIVRIWLRKNPGKQVGKGRGKNKLKKEIIMKNEGCLRPCRQNPDVISFVRRRAPLIIQGEEQGEQALQP